MESSSTNLILDTVKPGIYRHYKGGMYEVLGEATHTETRDTCVVYRHIESGEMYVRPKLVFLSPAVVLREQQVPRFVPVQE